ncbi:hypothetical protein [Nocardiopsis quinghaiensis]|uniref:hypothetical protein n=1 Tax=Nocardiopsis quinghaiensis TaxID=464995 RepID=UPI001CC223F2|nr:hypothetical protein [Nocardiopsis quinghaiensis]
MKFTGSIPKLTFTATSSLLLTSGLLLAGPGTAAADTLGAPDCSEDTCVTLASNDGSGEDTDADEAAAEALNSELNDDMAGHMTDDRVSHAREVVATAQERGMDQQGATIAVATVIVETHLYNNPGGDRDSVGLFQQRDHYGSHEQRLDPSWATAAFYDEMDRVYPGGSWADEPIGDVAQGVQRSAYPDRYQHQANDAEIIVKHLW